MMMMIEQLENDIFYLLAGFTQTNALGNRSVKI